MLFCIADELDKQKDLLVAFVNAMNKQPFDAAVIPSGMDFLNKAQETGWISPDNLNPLFDVFRQIERPDVFHKAILQALTSGTLLQLHVCAL